MPLALSHRAANWLVNANSLHFLSVHHASVPHCSAVVFSSRRAWPWTTGSTSSEEPDLGDREPSGLRYLPVRRCPSSAASDKSKIALVSLHDYKCLFNLSNVLSISTQKPETYLLWGRNSPRHEIIASKVLVIHGMALIALYLGDRNTTDFQIYPGALILQYWVGKL